MKRRSKQAVGPELLERFSAADAMSASGQEARKHHVVPRFYLDRWAEGNRVLVTDLDAGTSHAVDPKNALYQTDFYRVPAGTVVGTDSPVIWETWLSAVEGKAARAFHQFDKGGIRSLDEQALAELAGFIAVQTTRSRWYRYQVRWNASVGLFRAYELDKPGAVAARLVAAGEQPTPDRISEIEVYIAKMTADPWQMKLAASLEMDLAHRSAVGLNELLTTRKLMVYETEKPLLTGDEPVVGLWEDLAADHLEDGGWFGVPIIVFPMDPHHVLALFRQNMPLMKGSDTPLDWRETLQLNRAIAGNSYRHAVSQPSNPLASKLLIPRGKEPMEMQRGRDQDGSEIIRWRVVRRWSNEHGAPFRPVAGWWPPVLPAPPPGPRTQKEWDDERREWNAL